MNVLPLKENIVRSFCPRVSLFNSSAVEALPMTSSCALIWSLIKIFPLKNNVLIQSSRQRLFEGKFDYIMSQINRYLISIKVQTKSTCYHLTQVLSRCNILERNISSNLPLVFSLKHKAWHLHFCYERMNGNNWKFVFPSQRNKGNVNYSLLSYPSSVMESMYLSAIFLHG